MTDLSMRLKRCGPSLRGLRSGGLGVGETGPMLSEGDRVRRGEWRSGRNGIAAMETAARRIVPRCGGCGVGNMPPTHLLVEIIAAGRPRQVRQPNKHPADDEDHRPLTTETRKTSGKLPHKAIPAARLNLYAIEIKTRFQQPISQFREKNVTAPAFDFARTPYAGLWAYRFDVKRRQPE